MDNLIACRHTVFRNSDEGFGYLQRAGVKGIEASWPSDDDLGRLKKLADDHGLLITTVVVPLALGDEDALAQYAGRLEKVGAIGTPKVFSSVKGSDTVDRSVLIERFRSVADKAARLGITICTETHPPFGHNAAEMLRTMRDVDHPNVRVNFDTANVYYYNEGCTAVSEVSQVADYVASVHLKDTDGGTKSANFPILGQGVVDFPEVFRILGEKQFTGPYTFELEGHLMKDKDMEGRFEAVVACMDYLRSIGVAD